MNKFWRYSWQKSLLIILGVILCFGLIFPSPAAASLVKEPVTEVQVSLGNTDNELKFFPTNLKFVADKRYKLVITNPSPQKHYFTAKDFADAIWTQAVKDDKIEVKGAIREVEILPGGKAEWIFVALKPGNYSLRCPIPGHTEAGMIGQVAISAN